VAYFWHQFGLIAFARTDSSIKVLARHGKENKTVGFGRRSRLGLQPLFTENETELVSSESSADLQEIQAIDGAQLIIPRVVAGEILFRKDWGLAALRNDAARKLKAIGELVAGEQPSIADKKRLRLQLQRRFINWCTENSIKLWRVPFDKINWRHLTALAVSRLPPFSPFEPKGKSEKGFRDALVLETLCDICESVSPTRTIFICGDKLLGEAAFARLGSKQLSVYKSTAEYLSYVKLQRQNFVDETIKLVIEEATSLFLPHRFARLRIRQV